VKKKPSEQNLDFTVSFHVHLRRKSDEPLGIADAWEPTLAGVRPTGSVNHAGTNGINSVDNWSVKPGAQGVNDSLRCNPEAQKAPGGCVVFKSSDPPHRAGLTPDSFIERWSGREGGQERSNYSMFLRELCEVIGAPIPDPASARHEFNDYVFERVVERRRPDGTTERGRIDLYKRDCFILEAKQSRQKGAKKAVLEGQADLFADLKAQPAQNDAIDHLMINARRQAEGYAQALPKDHHYPPFLLTCDVGRTIEVYADFSGHGRHYTQFPDARNFRIELSQLTAPDVREHLRRIWVEPLLLDPAVQTAKVTREIAGKLAEVSKALEARSFAQTDVAVFLMRCLFTMFVEDVQLIRKDSFKELLSRCVAKPERFPHEMNDLWKHMDVGDYSPAVGEKLLRFNGKLFKKAQALPLQKAEIVLLRQAADADWRDLEPAIFGSLFEQALNVQERKQLGAHYTPRAYVERLVNATIIEPLTQDWLAAQASAERALRAGSKSNAVREVGDFLKTLSSVRVLDPACGTGNFLYVALRLMKQLEGEVMKQLQDLNGDDALRKYAGVSVKPDQFLGMEVNKRAIEIAELVLWIGYLQWHLRTRPDRPAEPVLGNSDHIIDRNALLTWDGYPVLPPRAGKGKTKSAYFRAGAKMPDWPDADFIVGNPPFIGGKDIRDRLGDDYAEALWKVHSNVNPSADYVMYWWDRAAQILTTNGTRLRRFGFVTTNSITQVFQRRVVEQRLNADRSLSIVLAIPDHPWTKATKDAAAVRIAMTVVEGGTQDGTVRKVSRESLLDTDEPLIVFSERRGSINADLTIGADLTQTKPLLSNDALCSPGVKLHGDGFIVDRATAKRLGLGRQPGLKSHIREYRNGKDLTGRYRDMLVIDLFGLNATEARKRFPEVYEHLLEHVKPQRRLAFEKSGTKDAQEYLNRWWLFGKPRQELRPALAGLKRYIATVETTKHRVFQFLDASILPDNMLIAIGVDDAYHLGVLSSRIHRVWALRAGGWLGVGNDPRYSKSRCFDPFPFPEATASLKRKIATLADELDMLRKRMLADHPQVTLTGLYNALEEIKAAAPLSQKSQGVKDQGSVLILKDLHEQIDALVASAYGWPANMNDGEILANLVTLNISRVSEERHGLIRWLRPDYQIDKLGGLAHRADRVQEISVSKRRAKYAFPQTPKDQAGRVLQLLRRSAKPLTAEEIALAFEEGDSVLIEVQDILQSFRRLGGANTFDNGRSYTARTA